MAVNKELQYAADTFLKAIRAQFPDAEIVEIKDRGKTVYQSGGNSLSAEDFAAAVGYDALVDDTDLYDGDPERQFDPDDDENQSYLLGYWDAAVRVWNLRISTVEEYDKARNSGRLPDCPVRPDTFYRLLWEQRGGWRGFLWSPDNPNLSGGSMAGYVVGDTPANRESIAQMVWAHRTSTQEGYRASVAAGAIPGAPMRPENAWAKFRWEKLLWPRSKRKKT